MTAEEKKSQEIQDRLEEKKLRPEKFESRYKHGGPMRTTKKKKEE